MMLRGYLAVLIVLVSWISSPALAVECTNPNPRSSDLWRQFESFVSAEYLHGGSLISSIKNPEIVGHALGRAASAVQGDPDRQIAFACLQLAIQQLTAQAVVLGFMGRGRVSDVKVQEKIIAAAMGMYDKKVKDLTGVTDTSPADNVYAGLVPGSPAPPDKTRTTTGDWQGVWMCKGPGNPTLTISGSGRGSDITAAYKKAHANQSASEQYRIEEATMYHALGSYVYRDANSKKGSTGQAGVWPGRFDIRADGDILTLVRSDDTTGWSGDYSCVRT